VLDPKNNLKGDTRYRVKVTTEVNDGANNLEAPYSWSFKTR
jgi:Big-like domain-containing protein